MVSRNSVEIRGHVKNPGIYALQDSMRIKDIVFKSGGFVDEEFFKRTYLDRADLIRYDENKINQNIISFNLGDLINNLNKNKNFLLMPGDIIKIYPKTIFKSVYEATVLGAVKNSGSFTVKNEMSLRDLILEAGGFDKDVYRYRIEISRVDPDNKLIDVYSTVSEIFIDRDFFESYSNISDDKILSKLNPKIMPYDIVFVRPDPNFSIQRTISIEGMVMYPGVYQMLSPDETVKDIMKGQEVLLKRLTS
jgi:Periplasmic protein involved in polysaccharide export